MRRRNSLLALVIGIAVAISSAPLAASAAPDAPPELPKSSDSGPTEAEAVGLIVRYAPGTLPTQGGEVTGAAGLSMQVSAGESIGRGLRTIEFDEVQSAEAAIAAAAQLEQSPLVIDAQPNYVYRQSQTIETTDADPLPSSFVTTQTSTTWGLGRIDQTSGSLDYKYIYDTTGEGVKAYIIDSGIRPTHTQFTGRLAAGFKLSKFASTGDCNGHGTHVAGTVGGTTYGVAKKVTLVPVRVFGCSDDSEVSTDELLLALNWIIADHQAGEPAVVNMSLGVNAVDSVLNSKVQDVINDGITVVVASGNEADYSCNYSPASAPNAITVNASTKGGNDAVYSNFGQCSDIYAPGSEIKSADSDSNIDTATFSGTSMASPHVAGVVARILSHYPTLTPAQVWTKVQAEATPFDPGLNQDIADYCSFFPWEAVCSWGEDPVILLFASRLGTLNPAPTPTISGSPVGLSTLTATVGSWTQTAPEPDADAELAFQWKRSGTSIPGANGLEYTLTPADVGKTITFSVTGNLQGFASLTKTSAATATVTKPALSAPQTVVTAARPGAIALEWTEPASIGGTISDYVIQYRPISSTTYVTFTDGVSTDLDVVVNGLKFGSSYYVKVAAKTEFGTGAFTPAVLLKTLTGLPTAPTGLTATAAPRSIQLDWLEPATRNGGTITDYVIRYRVVGSTTWKTFTDGVGTSTTATVTGLTPSRTYEFAVQAKTTFGSGSSATIKRSTLSGLPSAPATLAGSAELTSMQLDWLAPLTTNGGGEITDYVIRYRATGATTWITVSDGVGVGTTHTISGLTRNKSYEFVVNAKTSFGTGASVLIKKSTLSGAASAPTGLAAPVVTSKSMVLLWNVPAATNGGTITDYVVRYRVAGTTTWTTFADGVSTATNTTITGLTRNKSYDVNVFARTLAGSTSLSGSSVTLRVSTKSGVPSVPTVTTDSAAITGEFSGEVTLSVTSIADPFYPVTGYTVQYRLGLAAPWVTAEESLIGSGGLVTIPVILDAVYQVRASATSAAGTSAYSDIQPFSVESSGP